MLVLLGAFVVLLMFFGSFGEKLSILLSAAGMLLIVVGCCWPRKTASAGAPVVTRLASSGRLRYVPLALVALVDICGGLVPPMVSALVFALALVIAFTSFKTSEVSKSYTALLLTFLTTSIAFTAFRYFALDIGIDSWGYAATGSIIAQNGHYGVPQPTDPYYWPFPVMTIASSMLSGVAGIALPVSLFVFPGSLIALQPALVFLVANKLFRSQSAGALAGLIAVMEPTILEWVNAPIAESVAFSLFLLIILLLFPRRVGRKDYPVILLLFLTLVALHGGVAIIVCAILVLFVLRYAPMSRGRLIPAFVTVLVGYFIVSLVFDRLSGAIITDLLILLGLKSSGIALSLFSSGGGAIVYVWWGLPAGLCMAYLLFRKRYRFLALLALGLLGLSFLASILSPSLDVDRYGGLGAWVIIAIMGGGMLNSISGRRQSAVIAALVFLVSFSAVVTPTLSPEFGFGGPNLQPTTSVDRTAIVWLSDGTAGTNAVVHMDTFGAAYYSFLRYSSGYQYLTPPPVSYVATLMRNLSLPSPSVVFIRWADASVAPVAVPGPFDCSTMQVCRANIVYSNTWDYVAVT